MKKSKFDTRRIVIIAMLSAVLLLMSFTPLGYMNIGPLAISFNMIPVAIAAIALGPVEGMILGCVFGITSYLQCLGIGGVSAMGVATFSIKPLGPILTFIQRFVPRLLAGLLSGFIFKGVNKSGKSVVACFTTGFSAAFLNTILFMSALVLLFGRTEYVQGLINGKNVILWICSFVGINAVVEMIACCLVVGAVGSALYKYLNRR